MLHIFLSTESIDYWWGSWCSFGSWSCHPLICRISQEMLEQTSEAAMAAIGRRIATGGNWPTISYDGLLSNSNYRHFVTKSKHSVSFLSCIEFRCRRTAWCHTPGTAKQQTEFILSTCIVKYLFLVFAVVHCFSIFFSWIKVNEILARAFLQTFRQNRHWENTSWCFQAKDGRTVLMWAEALNPRDSIFNLQPCQFE